MKKIDPFFDIPLHAPACPKRVFIFFRVFCYLLIPGWCIGTDGDDINNLVSGVKVHGCNTAFGHAGPANDDICLFLKNQFLDGQEHFARRNPRLFITGIDDFKLQRSHNATYLDTACSIDLFSRQDQTPLPVLAICARTGNRTSYQNWFGLCVGFPDTCHYCPCSDSSNSNSF